MGKKRWAVWGLLLASAGLLALLSVYTGNVTVPQGAPPAAPAPAGPMAGWTICVDAGHGGYDGGAFAPTARTWEKEINLDVARRLAALLTQSGARAALTRETDIALAGEGAQRKRRDLQSRVDTAAGADAFISIHMNEYRDRSQSGPQVFYKKGAEGSRLLAGALQSALNTSLAPPRARQANTGEYYLLEHLSIPAVLVECGFLSNPAEEKKLLDENYRQQLAQAVHDGLREYMRLYGQ